uniref:Uncharacterized protein n=1 Tax=Setaria viridis TaxID=4556 RepID=A0A4U6TYK4_SETVI|nr:hypothetical protein SEVIR_6G004800v2 [Setaria viridis]
MEHRGLPLRDAVDRVVGAAPPDTAGMVAVSAQGEVCVRYNIMGMFRACVTEDGHTELAVWTEDIPIHADPDAGAAAAAEEQIMETTLSAAALRRKTISSSLSCSRAAICTFDNPIKQFRHLHRSKDANVM